MLQLSWLKDCKIIQWGGNLLYSLLIFAIVFDPRNCVIHMKDPLFILLVGYNCAFFKPDVTYLPHIMVAYCMVFLSYVMGEMQGNVILLDDFLATVKSYAPLVLLLWTPYYNVIRLSKIPVILVSILITVLYIAVCSSGAIEYFVWQYVKAHGEMIMMTHRSFFGIPIFGMYYKSIICFIFVLYVYYFKLLNEKKHKLWSFFVVLTLTFSFLVSGTRATMLLPFIMLGLVLYPTISKLRKVKYFFYPVLALFGFSVLLVIILLATEPGEASNAIKYAHLTSYSLLFESHPEYLFIGQGPGSIFYSAGFGRWTTLTEWTYIELIRNYGLFSLLFVTVILIPAYKLLKRHRNEQAFGILGAYMGFLFIAGTNPLLVSSTGMIVILAVYSYVHQLEHASTCGWLIKF